MGEPSRRTLLRRVGGDGGHPGSAVGADRRPVVLVHGYGDTGETARWRRLRRHPREDGYGEADRHALSVGDRIGEARDSPREYTGRSRRRWSRSTTSAAVRST
jgi:hypothetical protein